MARSPYFAAIATLTIGLLAIAHAASDKPGVLWEMTSETEMEGMPMKMPARTSKFCAAKEWTHAPGGRPALHELEFQEGRL